MAPRTAGWAAMAVFTFLTAGRCDASARPTIVLHVDAYARPPTRQWETARAEVDRIYATAGITILWREGRIALDGPQNEHFAVVLIDGQAPRSESATGDALGEASHETGRAYVYMDRINRECDLRAVDCGLVLGHVLAHEVGHLLLPRSSHASFGIMRPTVDFKTVGFAGFSSVQTEALVEAVGKRR